MRETHRQLRNALCVRGTSVSPAFPLFEADPWAPVFCGCENVAVSHVVVETYVVGCKQPVVGGTAELPSGVVTSCGARCCNSGITAERPPASSAHFGNRRQGREQRSGTVPIFVAGRHKNGTVPFGPPAVASGRWPVARTGSHALREPGVRQISAEAQPGRRPKAKAEDGENFGFVLSRRCPKRPHLSSAG